MQELRSWDILRAFYEDLLCCKNHRQPAESNEIDRSFFDLRGLHGESRTCARLLFFFPVHHLAHSTESTTKQTFVNNHAARSDPRRPARHGLYSVRGHPA